MKKFTINIGGKEIQILDNENKGKEVILGIHGLTGNSLQLGYFAEQFGKNYRFITMDLYGRANSKADGYESSIFTHAEDIHQLIDELELENVILMGYSMGGFIAAVVASESPKVKAVVLLDGAATMTEHQRPIVEPSLGRLSKHFESDTQYINEVATGYESFGIERNERLEEALAYEIENHGTYWENKGSEVVVRNDWESFWEFDPIKVGSKIDQPTLLVQASGEIGSNPPLFLPEHYEDTIDSIDNIETVTSDANHYTMVFENREDINDYISDFLKKIESN